MAAFSFVALDQSGRRQRGVREADSVRQIRQQLRDQGWAPLSVEPATSSTQHQHYRPLWQRGLNASDLALITRHLAILTGSGLSVEQALSATAEQSRRATIRSILLEVRSQVVAGHSLATALQGFPNTFNELYRSSVAAGEHAGHLPQVLEQLAEFTEQRQEYRSNVQLAMIYPFMLLLVSILIIAALLTFVVPEMIAVYADTGQDLPLLTRGLIGLSTFFGNWGLAMLGLLIATGVLMRYWLGKPGPRLEFHRLLLSNFFTRTLVRSTNASQFANTLAILTSSGVPLVSAMTIAAQVVPNLALREIVNQAIQRVTEGASLRQALEESDRFPPLMLSMIGSGEASGRLDEMLVRVAHHMDRDLQRTAIIFVELLKPTIMLLMGGIVLLIVLAILLPILDLNQLVQ